MDGIGGTPPIWGPSKQYDKRGPGWLRPRDVAYLGMHSMAKIGAWRLTYALHKNYAMPLEIHSARPPYAIACNMHAQDFV